MLSLSASQVPKKINFWTIGKSRTLSTKGGTGMTDSIIAAMPYVIAGGLFISSMMYLESKGVL
jgi:hypothetical protein